MSEVKAPERKSSATKLVLSEFLPYRIVALGHAISRRLSAVYERENLSIPEWRVLAVISQADAMSARDVVAMTPMDKMAVSRAVASLESKVLVERQTHDKDRRMAVLSLTAEGRSLFDRISQFALQFEQELVECLAPGDERRFLSILLQLEERARSDGGA